MNLRKQSLDGAPAVVASWAEEDACDKAKDEAADKSPVKGQVWEGLLYRHWDHWTGAKRSHVLVVSAGDGSEVRDLTPASVVGDAETPTWFAGWAAGVCVGSGLEGDCLCDESGCGAGGFDE